MAIITNVKILFWKKNRNRIDFIRLNIQLNLYIFLNGAFKKIIDNWINAVPTNTVTINKKKYKGLYFTRTKK